MKEIGKLASILLLAVIWVGCDSDYRRKASGSFGQLIVVMDSADFESKTAEALRQTFGGWTQTIPGKPPRFDLTFRDFDSNNELEQLKQFRNVIVASPIDDSTNVAEFMRALLSDEVERQVRDGEAFAFPLKDQWYRDQWLLLLAAPSDSALATQIKNSQKTLVDNLIDKELNRWTAEIYERGEQVALEDSLWQNHGWKIRVQHDWIKSIDTTYTENNERVHFLTMRRPLPNNDRWFWAWWKEVDNINHVDDDWINTKRDSLNKKWFEGSSTRRNSFVTTAYKRPHKTETFRMNGDLVYESRGVWRMTEDAMAGPFVNFTVYDKETSRLFMLEFAQFAPKYDKRKFVRQFRAMLRTFKSDSTWQANSQKSMAIN